METSAFNVLVLVAFGLMIVVSGGIVYLTIAEWRDRRRRDEERRADRPIARSTDKISRNNGKVKK
ncbi:hypothetical protein [Stenomitos frigidus]|uniref:Uncharacterized protein n=1 Tax=Stenomitos frigidus ULC18 TaxID=2107698 RepID=A0A2T1DUS0_9CYAN|nr:hypothetical protein [Stenomitos frigidus]PSB24212.1 hypothetical protein C7B82_27940 [Stenomitos frigidus ULC18]